METFEINACRGLQQCRNAVFQAHNFTNLLSDLFEKVDFSKKVKTLLNREPKRHERFKISVSCCPNGCSSPQISDVGIIFVNKVEVTNKPCSQCLACQKICPDRAIVFPNNKGPEILEENCLDCGKCETVCSTGSISTAQKGFKVMVGGKLGRRPRLGSYVPGIFNQENVLKVVENVLLLHLKELPKIKKFAEHFSKYDEAEINNKLLKI